jgi:hypothetical protein
MKQPSHAVESPLSSHPHFLPTTSHTMPSRRTKAQKKAIVPPSPPISSRIRKRGPSNADDKQSKPKGKKQRGDDDETSEVNEAENKAIGSDVNEEAENKATGSKKKERKAKIR